MRMGQASSLMCVGWTYSLVMASLPLFGVSSYGSVGICLPMEVDDVTDTVYVVALLVFSGVVFLMIGGCYVKMFLSVRSSENMARSNDTTVAKRMAILVLTNFVCWAPIAFFGLTATSGLSLITISNSKILLVFFYPFNSCVNPFLYSILTNQFRRDVFILLGRYGMCRDRANKYTRRAWPLSKTGGEKLRANRLQDTEVTILSQRRKSSKSSKKSGQITLSLAVKEPQARQELLFKDTEISAHTESPQSSVCSPSLSFQTSPMTSSDSVITVSPLIHSPKVSKGPKLSIVEEAEMAEVVDDTLIHKPKDKIHKIYAKERNMDKTGSVSDCHDIDVIVYTREHDTDMKRGVDDHQCLNGKITMRYSVSDGLADGICDSDVHVDCTRITDKTTSKCRHFGQMSD